MNHFCEESAMKWEDARSIYINKWILFEAIEAYSKDGKSINNFI